MKPEFQERFLWEAQYWWAFSCLALAGRRKAADFHRELMQRNAGVYPTQEQADSLVDEALTFIAEVLNSAVAEQQANPVPASGWERHLLALSTKPQDSGKAAQQDIDRFSVGPARLLGPEVPGPQGDVELMP